MQIFGRVVAVFLVLLGFAPFSNVVADTTQVFYGKLHISADAIQFEKSKEDRKLLSSNSTRVGFKGSEELGETMKAIWKLEGGLDLTGETSGFTVRNRYLGLINPLGMVVAGVHDTPYKSLGAKFDIMPNTIADRRSILGNVNGTRYLDNRAENALMYVSHVISGLELRFMASSGGAQEEGTEGGIDKNPVNSFSAIYKGNAGFLGAAYEENVNVGVDGVRLAAGFALT
ncbi:MAG: porin, partial [Gammaproteobacteria bacterium]|nr:porin [Gammaproteobacteria bacterium]